MNFQTDIETEGDEYSLDIRTDYREENGEPANIELKISINKVVGNEKYFVDKINLVYHTKTRSYDDSKNDMSRELYNHIINKLDETYGDLWGYTAN